MTITEYVKTLPIGTRISVRVDRETSVVWTTTENTKTEIDSNFRFGVGVYGSTPVGNAITENDYDRLPTTFIYPDWWKLRYGYEK